MEDKTFQLLEKMYSEFSERFEKLENEVSRLISLEEKVDKNTLLLEKANTDIKTLAEVQENYINQNIKQHNEIINKLDSDIDVIKSSIKSLSKDFRFIKHKLHQTEEDVFDIKDHLKIIK
ncbi:MAG: hypothetical protein PWQ37_2889 [Candidatus Petromonas sp.]|jgi:archaellum component FlaC|nr:hypothetical protein [Candidatus Petromonas sp.]